MISAPGFFFDLHNRNCRRGACQAALQPTRRLFAPKCVWDVDYKGPRHSNAFCAEALLLSSIPAQLSSSSSPPDNHFENMSRSAEIDQTGWLRRRRCLRIVAITGIAAITVRREAFPAPSTRSRYRKFLCELGTAKRIRRLKTCGFECGATSTACAPGSKRFEHAKANNGEKIARRR